MRRSRAYRDQDPPVFIDKDFIVYGRPYVVEKVKGQGPKVEYKLCFYYEPGIRPEPVVLNYGEDRAGRDAMFDMIAQSYKDEGQESPENRPERQLVSALQEALSEYEDHQ